MLCYLVLNAMSGVDLMFWSFAYFQQRTTMILLCEDGSLRIYMANIENTKYWLSPYLQPQNPIAALRPTKKKICKSGNLLLLLLNKELL